MAQPVSGAISQAADHVRLSGSGTGMMTVVRTQFVPLSDSLSDSDSDAEVSFVVRDRLSGTRAQAYQQSRVCKRATAAGEHHNSRSTH